MKDRFKFRCYNNKDNTMYDVYSFDKSFIRANPYNACINSIRTFKTSDCVLMQCTGLKDKNGKLIYELDYIKYKNTEYKIEINKFFNISLINISSGDIINMNEEILLNCEVISNEFERNAKI